MNQRLAAIYAKIPDVMCQGKCARTCATIPVHRLELNELRRASGVRLRVVPTDYDENTRILKDKRGHCPLLKDDRCTTYDSRPMICRLYGAVEDLRCPFGCKPERFLTGEEARAIMAELHGY